MSLPRIVPTPIAAAKEMPPERRPRRVAGEVLEAILPGPGRDRLARGEALVVTTGQQPGLFTGPLYTIYKAITTIAVSRRLERERGVPVVPVFWVAGDDHDFAEANHAWILDTAGEPARITLRERPAEAPLLPLARERCGAEVAAALDTLRRRTPDTEFKPGVLAWLEAAYRVEATLADAFSDALHALLGGRGLAVFRAHHPAAKRAMAPFLVRALAVTLQDGYSPVLLEATAGRDRLRVENGAFLTRRSGERFSRADLERVAVESPERLSPNVLLRPAVEAALFPTVAYAAGPSELEYFPRARPLYPVLGDGVEPQTPLARWSGVLLEGRVEKVLAKHGLTLDDLASPPGVLEARILRESLPPEVVGLFAQVREHLETDFGRLGAAIARIDPTLERTALGVRNAALGGTADLEKKVVAALKRANETLTSQLARARAAVYPAGAPQERVLTLASFLLRYGPSLMDALEDEVARWAGAS
ncbi:MAG TPA: bacillithiol biosynthesis BshC [Gemmatimonadales bacterium]|nr:bacillithiol biosynthesis BshC [Gemmatimonadales bacterium]